MADHKRFTLATDIAVRSQEPLATRIKRKHQWLAAAVLPQRNRLVCTLTRTPGQPQAFAALVRQTFRKHWVVCCKRPFGGAEHVLRYLGGYTHRVAISHHRLLSLQDGKVTFRWRDSAHHNQQRRLCLPVEEFLRRFLLHVLPPGFVRIRHFGILSTRHRSTLLPLCRQLLEAAPPPPGCRHPRPEPAVPQPALWRCPQCGGPMLLVERLTAGQLRFRAPPLQTLLSAV